MPNTTTTEWTPREKFKARCEKIGNWEDVAFFLRGRGIHLTGNYIYLISRGKRSPSNATAAKLAKALGLAVKDVAKPKAA